MGGLNMMKSTLSIFLSAAAFVLAMVATPAHAQATRTWVSGIGDDLNPCSRTAPCRTFAGAISKTATNGEINCLDPGSYGAVTITKSITIDCHEIFAAILATGINGITVNYDSFAAADSRRTVRLRNININGADTGLTGIRILGGAQSANSEVAIEDCLIDGFFGSPGRGINDGRSNGGKLWVNNTTVRNMGGAGVIVQPASGSVRIDASISNVRVFNSQTGVAALGGSKVVVANSVVSGNTFGLDVEGAGSEMLADTVVVSSNGTGLSTTGGGVLRIGSSNIAYNTTGASGTVNSFTTNRFIGNGGGSLTVIAPPNTNPSAQN
jgi:hypothetical protein